MEEKNKKSFLPVLLIILLTVVLIIVGIFVYYNLTKKDIRKYVPNDFVALLKIESVSKTYENLINLKASDIILSGDDFKNILKTLQDIRASKFAKNKMIINLLNMQAHVIIDKSYSPTFIFDIGLKSLLFNGASVLSQF
ncbi:MAG TPA: hypothetical protein PK771_15225, partial [Spirochaetota bacterium]|nr:hypothetical protein [Spirochaetota bacterium]